MLTMCESKDNKELESGHVIKVSSFRRILPQVIATTIKNFIIIDVGLTLAMPIIIISALTGISNEHNQGEKMTLEHNQATWIGSIVFLALPFGSSISGLFTDGLGRKRSLLLVNIPYAIGWFLLYRSTEVWHIYISLALLGLAFGLSEAAIITYVGELSETSVRGILVCYSYVCVTIGSLIGLILNTLMSWRMVALICLSVPIISSTLICLIPETPQWFLSKNRTEEAKKSLCWFRGWVPAEAIAQEFRDLQRHSIRSKSCNTCIKQDMKCSHPLPTFREKLSELKRKSTLKPFAILIPLFFLQQFTGTLAMRPYIVQIFKAYDSPVTPSFAAVLLNVCDSLGQLTFLCSIRFTGKRHLFLTMASGVFITTFIISCYGFIILPSGCDSFNQQNHSFHLENSNLAWIPMACLFMWSYFSFAGFIYMPWILLSELFGFKIRGFGSGITAAVNYILGFITRKTYYSLETSLSMAGLSLLYCIITGIGLVYAYFTLPETEGRSLEDIELHFADDSKKLTDIKIARRTAKKINNENPNVESGILE